MSLDSKRSTEISRFFLLFFYNNFNLYVFSIPSNKHKTLSLKVPMGIFFCVANKFRKLTLSGRHWRFIEGIVLFFFCWRWIQIPEKFWQIHKLGVMYYFHLICIGSHDCCGMKIFNLYLGKCCIFHMNENLQYTSCHLTRRNVSLCSSLLFARTVSETTPSMVNQFNGMAVSIRDG